MSLSDFVRNRNANLDKNNPVWSSHCLGLSFIRL